MDKTEPVAPLEVIPSKSAALSFRRLMKICKSFLLSRNIRAALLVTSQSLGNVTDLAGEIEGMIFPRQRHHSRVDDLVDITSLSEIKPPQQDYKDISLGAAITNSNALHAPPLSEYIHETAQADDLVGELQVHRVFTVNRTISRLLLSTNSTIRSGRLMSELRSPH